MRKHAAAFALAAAVAACDPTPPLAIEAQPPAPVVVAPPPAPVVAPPAPVAPPTPVAVPVQAVEAPPRARTKGGDVKAADPREVKAWAKKKD